MPTYNPLSNSTFLDGFGANLYSAQQYQDVNTHGITYSAFAQGNETVNGQQVVHLWNYGLNIWGWEDTYGGDHDYDDLIVQIEFTSASGHGWLV